MKWSRCCVITKSFIHFFSQQLQVALDIGRPIRNLKDKPLEYWKEKITEFFIDPHHVFLKAIPSEEVGHKERVEERERIEGRLKNLESIKAENRRVMPEVFKIVTDPNPNHITMAERGDLSSISYTPATTYTNIESYKYEDKTKPLEEVGFNGLPFKTVVVDGPTENVLVCSQFILSLKF